MKYKIISLLANLFLFFIFTSLKLQNKIIGNIAQEGNKIIIIRHALAPGSGDPKGFKIDDCKTQRNLRSNRYQSIKKNW